MDKNTEIKFVGPIFKQILYLADAFETMMSRLRDIQKKN